MNTPQNDPFKNTVPIQQRVSPPTVSLLSKSPPPSPKTNIILHIVDDPLVSKKRSIIAEDEPQEDIQPMFENKTVKCILLPKEECTLQITPESKIIKTIPLYCLMCDDELFKICHYMKPIKTGDNSFDICVKNLSDEKRNIFIIYYMLI